MFGLLGDSQAVRIGVNKTVKSVFGLRHKGLVDRSWRMSGEDFWSYQRSAFANIYRSARDHIPYYRERPDEYPALNVESLGLEQTLSRLPILSKDSLRKNNEQFWADSPSRFTRFHTTSGTTGTPLRIAVTLNEHGLTSQILKQWMDKVAGPSTRRTLYLTGFFADNLDSKDVVWRDRLTGASFLSIFKINETHKPEIAEVIRELRPTRIEGYAAAINQLAHLFDPGELAWLRQECVAFTTASTLEDYQRKQIETTLCGRVFDYYGSREGQHLAVECVAGAMHINPLAGIVEILDEKNQPTRVGDVGRVVVTGLKKPSFPLIRYEIGDAAVSTGFEQDCACGLKWPTVGRIVGRADDLARTRNGGRVGHLVGMLTKDVAGIKECQLVQRSVNRFEFSMVVTSDYHSNSYATEREMIRKLSTRLGEPISVDFRYVETIPKGPGGKLRALVVDFEGEGNERAVV